MSQIYKPGSGSGPPPPTGVLQLTPDLGSAVVPTAGNINLTGTNTGVNQSTPDTNFETFNAGTSTMQIAHRYQGKASTVGATTQTIVTIPMSAGSTITALALVTATEPTGPNAIGGQVTGVAFRGVGGSVLLTTSDTLIGTTTGASAGTFAIGVLGDALDVTVTGVAGLTIEWYAIVIISQQIFS